MPLSATHTPEPPVLAADATAALVSPAMPKEEIGAARFLRANPASDGRGVLIAILDTGVDPGAAGLCGACPDGSPKLVDVLDCTGSGDVDMSCVRTAGEDGCVESVTGGRRLALNKAWTNPQGEWRVGCIRAYALFPGGLKERITAARAEEVAVKRRKAVTAARTAATAAADGGGSSAAAGGGLTGRAARKAREEADARVALLSADPPVDLGPMVECVVWHDGARWLAALDTTALEEDAEAAAANPAPPGRAPPVAGAPPRPASAAVCVPPRSGALADFEPLTNFKDCRRHATLSARDSLNVALNIFNDGAVLSIVADAGSHGSHVAAIAAAHHPDTPELNGVAPGAQIMSCKIGDSRLGSMETGTGLARGIAAAVAAGADIINLSYGEATATPDAGRLIELIADAVNNAGVLFISSAGNAGPALGTVGAPGGTSTPVISVGAYVSPALATAAHSARVVPPGEGAQYTWSSRGPTSDGHPGVTISAPGGAVASVPCWTRQARQLMNGTSMASPCAAGGVALVVGAAKAALAAAGAPPGSRPSPARVRRAIENTATPLGGDAPDAVLTYGRGLLQVDAAAAYLARELAEGPPDCRYEVTVRRSDGHAGSARGLVVRDPACAGRASVSATAFVAPTLHARADVASEHLAIDDRIAITTTAPWLAAPPSLMLPANGRSFEVEAALGGLPEGLHYGEVLLSDGRAPWRGPLARVPVTVIKPSPVDTSPGAGGGVADLGTVHFSPGTEARRFLAAPPGATWAVLRVRAGPGADPPRGLMLRLTQVDPHTRYTDSEARTFVSLGSLGEAALAARVRGGATLEVCASQFWSSGGETALSLAVSFHGVTADPSSLALEPGGVGKVLLTAPFRAEKVKPTAKVTGLRWSLRPTKSALAPLSPPRDALPSGGRLTHGLCLTYSFEAAEAGDYRLALPSLTGFLYDAPTDAQMVMAFDAHKRLLGVSDVYPARLALPKGKLTLRAWVRHDDPAFLAGLADAPLRVERAVEGVTLPVHTTHAAAVAAAAKANGGSAGKKNGGGGGDGGGDAVGTGVAASASANGGAFKERTLQPGERAALFVGPLPDAKLPKDAAPGCVLVGSLTLGRKATCDGGGDAPGGLAFSLLVGPPPAKKKEEEDEEEDEEEEVAGEGEKKGAAAAAAATKRATAVLDAEVAFLGGLKPGASEDAAAEADALFADALARHPAHLPLLRARVAVLASLEGAAKAARSPALLAACEVVVKAVDKRALADAAARKAPDESPGAAKRAKARAEEAGALAEALAAKARALLEAAPAEDDDPAPFQAAVEELKAWADGGDAKVAALLAEAEARAGRPACALTLLDKAIGAGAGKPADRKLLERRVELLRACGWEWAAEAAADGLRDAFPAGWAPW